MVNNFIFDLLPALSNAKKQQLTAARPWFFRRLLACLLLAGCYQTQAQTLENLAVRASAVVRNSPPQIKLMWPADAQATNYHIFRKGKNSTSWGNAIAQVYSGAATLTEYADNTVVAGVAYEYYIRKATQQFGEGYVLAGITVPATENRGKVVLVVDDTHAAYLAADLTQLQADLVGDGWQVIRHDVAPTLTPPQVKALIRADYQAAPTQVKVVFLLGHVAVPYAGEMYPDGHPDHYGAWPADVYYGDMNGSWTDSNVNTAGASRPANRNVPGDGKFDDTYPAGDVDLQVGRVDLSQLPAFALSERDLLRRYLLKDHQFRHKQFTVAERGLIDDNFGVFGGETFANNGWRNFSALCGPAAVTNADYFSTLGTQDYMWAYACGSGSYAGMVGVGSTANFAAGPVKSVFNMMFGSYFGDWDNSDNLLRAPLAADGYTLTNCWAGRPNWSFHQMGLGETIGYCTRITQMYSWLYTYAYGSGFTHVALMGDPTLRMHVVAPAARATATASTSQVALTWTASPDAAAGYYVYRAATPNGPFTRLTAQPLATTTFADPAPLTGTNVYMVRARQLKIGSSGSYYNLSQGIFTTVQFSPPTSDTWLGTQSTDWNTAANWTSGTVPGIAVNATIPVTANQPVVTGGPFPVATLTLLPGAQLTVAAGGELRPASLLLQPGATTATSMVLGAGTASSSGGQLQLSSDLTLPTGTTLTVGNYAEIGTTAGLVNNGSTLSFAPLGRLGFGAVTGTSGTHTLSGSSSTTVGILQVKNPNGTLALSSPLRVLSQVENHGSIGGSAAGSLTLLATPGRTAILAPVMESGVLRLGTYTRNITAQLYLDGSRHAALGYRHLTTPLTGPSFADLAVAGVFTPVVNSLYNTQGGSAVPFPTVFGYSQSRLGAAGVPGPVGFDQGWQSPDFMSTRMGTAQGYTVSMPANVTMSFTGAPVTSTQYQVNGLGRSAQADGGWQLLGNPYNAPLNWDQLVADNGLTQLDAALYVFKSNGQYTGTYASYLPGVGGAPGIGLNGGSNMLPVGQGFFVRSAPTAGLAGASITFSLNALLTAPDPTLLQRTTPDTRPRLRLTLRNSVRTVAHQTAIYFQAGATPGPDATFDALYLPGAGQAVAVASESGPLLLGINGLPLLTGGDVLVPLRLTANSAGVYELAIDTLANLPAGYHAYLHDAQTGTFADLAITPTIAVALVANAPVAGRYAVLFTTQSRLLATAPHKLAGLVSLYPNPAHGSTTLLVPPALRAGQPLLVEVHNALGQQVLAGALGATDADRLELPLAGLAPGVYCVLAHTAAGTVSRRLVVE